MRFLIISQYYSPEVGAAQLRLAAFARELRRRDHDVEVVTALPNYPSGALDASDRRRLARRETRDGIPITRMWLYPASGTGGKRLISYFSFAATSLAGGMSARKPDVVFVESPPLFLGVTGWLTARRFGARVVLNISDLWPDSVRDLGLLKGGPWLPMADWLEAWLYKQVDGVTAVTAGIRERLIGPKSVPVSKLLFLPNGIDTDTFRPATSSPRPTEVRPTFVFAGNHGMAQGLDVIVRAAKLVPEFDFRLIGDGSDKARLEGEAKRLGTTNVRFEPTMPAEGVAEAYASASGGVVTLRHSDLMAGARPAKLLAVMACGRPVIYSGEGEGADLVLKAEAGLVAQPEDPEALAAAARWLVEDPQQAQALGENGRRYVLGQFSWPALVGNWLDQLDGLLRKSGRSR